MSAKHTPVGANVEVTVNGTVEENTNDSFTIKTTEGRSLWFPRALVDTKVTKRPVSPGQVWSTSRGEYYARISRLDLELRMMPTDLDTTSGLKTITVTEFFVEYPDAILMYAPTNSKAARRYEAAQRHPAGKAVTVNKAWLERGKEIVENGVNGELESKPLLPDVWSPPTSPSQYRFGN